MASSVNRLLGEVTTNVVNSPKMKMNSGMMYFSREGFRWTAYPHQSVCMSRKVRICPQGILRSPCSNLELSSKSQDFASHCGCSGTHRASPYGVNSPRVFLKS